MAILRPFLDKLKEIQQGGEMENMRRLQLISTDTWDISDNLSNYTDIANILQVTHEIHISGFSVIFRLEFNYDCGRRVPRVRDRNEETSSLPGGGETQDKQAGHQPLAGRDMAGGVSYQSRLKLQTESKFAGVFSSELDTFQDRLQSGECDECCSSLLRHLQELQEGHLSSEQ